MQSKLEEVASNGLEALRICDASDTTPNLSPDERDAITKWSSITRGCCNNPRPESIQWFQILARDVTNFPLLALKELNNFQWYRVLGNTTLLQTFGEFLLTICTACSQHVLSIINNLVYQLANPHQFPAGFSVTVGNKTFESQQALKVHCREILIQYTSVKRSDNQNYEEAHAIKQQSVARGSYAEISEEHSNFLRQLLTHHPRPEKIAGGCEVLAVGTHPTYDHHCFFFKTRDGSWVDFSYRRCAENVKTANALTQGHIAQVIGSILRLCPSYALAASKMLEDRVPHIATKWVSITDHRNYLQALLYLAESSVLTESLLRFVLRRLGNLDCEVADMEENITVQPNEESLDETAQLLDAQMSVIFSFLQSRLARNTNSGREKSESANRLAKLTLSVFEEMTLLLHRTQHVQFIYFYICSLNQQWAEQFLIRLLQVLYDNNQSILKRKQAQKYLGSIIVRAKFLSTTYTVQTTRYLIEWLNDQLQDISMRSPIGVEGEWDPKWLMFHQSLEVVIYVLCWKIEEFINADVGSLWDGAEGSRTPLEVLFCGPERNTGRKTPKSRLVDVLMHHTRPAKRICGDLYRRFLLRMEKLYSKNDKKLSWWSSLQQDLTPQSDWSEEDQVTDTLFAFEPYRLRNSHSYVKNIFRCWSEVQTEEIDYAEEAQLLFELEVRKKSIGCKRPLEDGEQSEASRSRSEASGTTGIRMGAARPSSRFNPRGELHQSRRSRRKTSSQCKLDVISDHSTVHGSDDERSSLLEHSPRPDIDCSSPGPIYHSQVGNLFESYLRSNSFVSGQKEKKK